MPVTVPQELGDHTDATGRGSLAPSQHNIANQFCRFIAAKDLSQTQNKINKLKEYI